MMIPNLKITFVITNLVKCGGTERAVISVANSLADYNYTINIISLNSAQEATFFPINEKINIIHLGQKSYENGNIKNKVIGYFKSYHKIKKHLKSHKTDIIIGTSRNTTILSLISPNNARSIIGCEHFSSSAPINSIIRIIRDRLYTKLNRLIVLTPYDQKYYSNKGINTTCIPNSIPFAPQDCLNEKKNIAIALGRHSREKAFDKLIKLWNKIDRKDWELKIIGEGPLLEYNKSIAKQYNSDNIKFEPFTKNVIPYYRQAKLYLMTSIFEAFPMVLLEAKTCQCVCVSFDCKTGPKELINNNIDGFVIDVNDDKSFIEHVKTLMDNENKCNEMGIKAQENSLEYSSENITQKWITLINEL